MASQYQGSQADEEFPLEISLGPPEAREQYELQPDLVMLHFSENLREDPGQDGAHDGPFDQDRINEYLLSELELDDNMLEFHDDAVKGKGIDAFGQRALYSAGMRLIPLPPGLPVLSASEVLLARDTGGLLKTAAPVYYRAGWRLEKAAVLLFHNATAVLKHDRSRDSQIGRIKRLYGKHGANDLSLVTFDEAPGFADILLVRSAALQRDPRLALRLFGLFRSMPGFQSVEPGSMRLVPFGMSAYTQPPDLNSQRHLAQIAFGSALWGGAGPVSGNIKVGIVDDAFDNHPDLNIVNGQSVDRSGYLPDPHQWGPYPDSGHGTMVAGLIGAKRSSGPSSNDVVGIAPGCDLHVARIGPGVEPDEVIAAIHWLTAVEQVGVINLSLHTIASTALTYAIQTAALHDVVICAAAGNGGATYCSDADSTLCPIGVDFPASLSDVIAVGATATEWGERKNCKTPDLEAWQSQWGADAVDVVAPGVWLWTTDERGALGLTVSGEPLNPNGGSPLPSGTADGNYYALAGATSGATALVSGLAALIRSQTSASTSTQPGAARTAEIIKATCRKVMDKHAAEAGVVSKYYEYRVRAGSNGLTKSDATGYGLIDCAAAVAEAKR